LLARKPSRVALLGQGGEREKETGRQKEVPRCKKTRKGKSAQTPNSSKDKPPSLKKKGPKKARKEREPSQNQRGCKTKRTGDPFQPRKGRTQPEKVSKGEHHVPKEELGELIPPQNPLGTPTRTRKK